MTEATKSPEKASKKIGDPQNEFREAVDWVVMESIDSGICAVCTWIPQPHSVERSLAEHVRSKHRDTVVDLFRAKSCDLSTLREDPLEEGMDPLLHAAGIVELLVPERFDHLLVPKRILRDIHESGGRGRWVRKDRMDYFLGEGAELTKLKNDERGAKQPSTEDNNLRTNELVHMTFPHEVAQGFDRRKQENYQGQLNARAEEMTIIQDAQEKATVDHLMKEKNYDFQHASQVAGALKARRIREQGRG